MTSVRTGEAKVPGGKFVRVTLTDRARIDGDFFLEDASVLDAAARVLDAMPPLEGEPDGWYDEAASRLRPVLGRALAGVDAEAVALAAVRALGATDGFERRRRARVGRLRAAAGNADGADALPDAEVARRWRALRPRVVRDVPRGPDEQMAVDDRWAAEVADGRRPSTLRFWQWAAPAVVVGRYQSIPDEVDVEAAQQLGFQVVRRSTGGGAMLVVPELTITYSLYAPAGFTQGLGTAAAFRLCDAWLVAALRDCGIDARFSGLNDIASPRGKIGGAAARRLPGGLLHHVTLAYGFDATLGGRLLRTSAEKLSDKAVKSATRRVDPLDAQVALTRTQVLDVLERTAASFPDSPPDTMEYRI
ncbi:lipoate-protein ligase A [Bifidobacterium cuniculi]|uniref:Lipoate-protein ligase A n=2 Tax=Bifidobacterium cuniculi TaxID=1688 RepID=A0A087AT22_9BIFI|nr:lipoate--protein ligase family protein [Bifidobacterium cuniculi]KFI61922.1 lipoate-protein ligase A [Bifidobacterium cuniculi]